MLFDAIDELTFDEYHVLLRLQIIKLQNYGYEEHGSEEWGWGRDCALSAG